MKHTYAIFKVVCGGYDVIRNDGLIVHHCTRHAAAGYWMLMNT